MRLRYDKTAKEKIRKHPHLIKTFERDEAENLTHFFENKNPLECEIGSGKGRFIYTKAQMNPNINYFGFELFDSAIVKGLNKSIKQPLPNLLWVRADAQYFKRFFDPNSLQAIYLNFSDPWPKARHEKRRLTHPNFLEQYAQCLTPEGHLEMKTDNHDLFFYSLESFKASGWTIIEENHDLHQTPKDNIMTEFEERFSKIGPIYYLKTRRIQP